MVDKHQLLMNLHPDVIEYWLCYAKLLQSCPTLCNPMDCSPPGSSAHGIFQARVLEWGATAFSNPINRCQQIWKTQQCPQDLKRSVSIPIPTKGNAKECSNYRTTALISHTSKVMLKILQVRLQQYVNWEFQMFKLDLEKAENQRSNCQHPFEHRKSKRIPEKHLLLLHWLH